MRTGQDRREEPSRSTKKTPEGVLNGGVDVTRFELFEKYLFDLLTSGTAKICSMIKKTWICPMMNCNNFSSKCNNFSNFPKVFQKHADIHEVELKLNMKGIYYDNSIRNWSNTGTTK